MARPTLFTHRKFRTLARLLRSRALAVGSLELIWAAANESGDPLIGTAEDVEDVADWRGKAGVLVSALLSCGFLDDTSTGYVVHDHAHHCPSYVQKRWLREQQRKDAGYSRERNGLPYATVDAVFARERKCANCGSTDRLEIDHIIPRASGGGNELSNLQLLCMSCNKKKGAKNRPTAVASDSSDAPLLLHRTAVGRTPISHLPSPISQHPVCVSHTATETHTPTLVGSHKRHACCGYVCLPADLFTEFVRKSGHGEEAGATYVSGWFGRVNTELEASKPVIGDDDYRFWRARWAQDHPTAVLSPRDLERKKAAQELEAWSHGARP